MYIQKFIFVFLFLIFVVVCFWFFFVFFFVFLHVFAISETHGARLLYIKLALRFYNSFWNRTWSISAQYAATTNHTNLIQNYRWTVATEKDMEALKPCCSPISYRSQSILYFDGDKLQEARIPNIAATACGCMWED